MFFWRKRRSPSLARPGGAFMLTARCGRCGELISARISTTADISLTDDGRRYLRKLLVGSKCQNQVEVELYLDSAYRVLEQKVQGGELVSG